MTLKVIVISQQSLERNIADKFHGTNITFDVVDDKDILRYYVEGTEVNVALCDSPSFMETMYGISIVRYEGFNYLDVNDMAGFTYVIR